MHDINKKLYLHIGMPKTGTSYLQYFLSHNSISLLKHGIVYPDLSTGYIYNKLSRCGVRNGNAYSLAYTYLENQSITNCPEKGITLDNLALIMKVSNKNVLLSSEWLTLLKSNTLQEIFNLANLFGFEMKIICYIRRQDLFIESSYNQRIKINRSYISFDDFLYVPNFYDSLHPFIVTFPEKLISIRCMEKSQLKNGNIIDDFLSLLGISGSEDFGYPAKHINKSLSFGSLNMLNEMNKNGFKQSTAMNLLIDVLEDMPSSNQFDIIPSWLSPVERHNFMKIANKHNAYIVQRFFDRGKKGLFLEPLPAIDSEWFDARNQLFKKGEVDELIKMLKHRQRNDNMNDILLFIQNYKQQFL